MNTIEILGKECFLGSEKSLPWGSSFQIMHPFKPGLDTNCAAGELNSVSVLGELSVYTTSINLSEPVVSQSLEILLKLTGNPRNSTVWLKVVFF